MSEESTTTTAVETAPVAAEVATKKTPVAKPAKKTAKKKTAKARKENVKAKAKAVKKLEKADAKEVRKAHKKIADKSARKASKPTRKAAMDDAKKVAKASDGKLNTDQVRILRSLLDTKESKTKDRNDIKEDVGIGHEGLYSQKWLDSLWNLKNRKLISIGDAEPKDGGRSKHFHFILTAGKELLKTAEKAASKVAE